VNPYRVVVHGVNSRRRGTPSITPQVGDYPTLTTLQSLRLSTPDLCTLLTVLRRWTIRISCLLHVAAMHIMRMVCRRVTNSPPSQGICDKRHSYGKGISNRVYHIDCVSAFIEEGCRFPRRGPGPIRSLFPRVYIIPGPTHSLASAHAV